MVVIATAVGERVARETQAKEEDGTTNGIREAVQDGVKEEVRDKA